MARNGRAEVMLQRGEREKKGRSLAENDFRRKRGLLRGGPRRCLDDFDLAQLSAAAAALFQLQFGRNYRYNAPVVTIEKNSVAAEKYSEKPADFGARNFCHFCERFRICLGSSLTPFTLHPVRFARKHGALYTSDRKKDNFDL